MEDIEKQALRHVLHRIDTCTKQRRGAVLAMVSSFDSGEPGDEVDILTINGEGDDIVDFLRRLIRMQGALLVARNQLLERISSYSGESMQDLIAKWDQSVAEDREDADFTVRSKLDDGGTPS